MFVEFIKCKDCIYLFNILPVAEVENHYNIRKNVKRCIGCEKLEKYYQEKEKQKNKKAKIKSNRGKVVSSDVKKG